jgi:hypothetical protein
MFFGTDRPGFFNLPHYRIVACTFPFGFFRVSRSMHLQFRSREKLIRGLRFV